MNEKADWEAFWNEETNSAAAENAQGSEGCAHLRGAVLAEAGKVINGERQDAYGNPEDSFAEIGTLWGWYLGRPLSPSDVAMMMVLLKFAREKNQRKRDNVVDACGYLALYADIVDRQ